MATDGQWRVVAEQPPVNTEFADTAFRQPRMGAYIEQLRVYNHAIRTDSEPPVTGMDGLIGVQVALAFLESSRTHKVITL